MELSEIQHKEPPANKAKAQKRAKALAVYLKEKIGGNWKASIGMHRDEWRSWALCGTMKVFSIGLDDEPESPFIYELYGCVIKIRKGGHIPWEARSEEDPTIVVNRALGYLKYDAELSAKLLQVNLSSIGQEYKTELKYKPITSEAQYKEYCRVSEKLDSLPECEETEAELEVLWLLINQWAEKQDTLGEVDPVRMLKSIMVEWAYKVGDIAKIMGVSAKTASDILSYKKGFPKKAMLKLASRFKLQQDAFNEPYVLKNHPLNKTLKNDHAAVMNTVKKLAAK